MKIFKTSPRRYSTASSRTRFNSWSYPFSVPETAVRTQFGGLDEAVEG